MSDVGDELWAWQVMEQPDVWSLVGATVPTTDGKLAHMPLINRNRTVIEQMERWAKAHAEKTGQPLRFAHFRLVDDGGSA